MKDLIKEKTFFNAGDIVRLKKYIDIDAPKMIVKAVNKSNYNRSKAEEGQDKINLLIGITCFWFTKDYLYQEQRFNTKDLEKI